MQLQIELREPFTKLAQELSRIIEVLKPDHEDTRIRRRRSASRPLFSTIDATVTIRSGPDIPPACPGLMERLPEAVGRHRAVSDGHPASDERTFPVRALRGRRRTHRSMLSGTSGASR
jgi:hypothetical protein